MSDPNNTIFDDVFRTMLSKMPSLIIPLINDIFHTDYPPDIPVMRYQDEFYDRHQKIIADSHFSIADLRYHGECQSTSDSSMHIRMLEYDTAIGLEYITKDKNEAHLTFPQSFVLYLTSTSRTHFPTIHLHLNNCSIPYQPIPVYLRDYSLAEIFEKHLIFLIPFYIIRYRSRNISGSINKSSDTYQKLIHEYRSIKQYLTDELLNKGNEYFYINIITLSNDIINYIFADNESVRKGLGEIMGGQILELETERLHRIGMEEGISQERESGIRTLVLILHQQKLSRDTTANLVATNYQLSADETETYMQKYWTN